MPPLGSIAHTCTDPSRMHGPNARTSDHSTDPFPDPVAPATRTWEPSSRSRHGDPFSHRPMGNAARSTPVDSSAAPEWTRLVRPSLWVNSNQIRPGRATTTRTRCTSKVCASCVVCRSKSSGDCPDNRSTRTRSTHDAAITLRILGRYSRPFISCANPQVNIAGCHQRP